MKQQFSVDRIESGAPGPHRSVTGGRVTDHAQSIAVY